MSITIDPINERNVAMFKATRLAALLESPSAFGSTYGGELQLTDGEWRKRAIDWSSDRRIGFLAISESDACGIVGAHVNEQDASLIHLVSMWVAPSHRRQGIGGALIKAVVDWARGRGARRIRLMVTSNNMGAFRFYEQNGFSLTGHIGPYPNDPNLCEYEMARDTIVLRKY